MCLAIPMRVVELDLPMGMVELEGVRRQVHLGFLEDVELGDYVLVHAGCAVERLDPERAREDLELLRMLLRLSDEAEAEERPPESVEERPLDLTETPPPETR